MISTKEGLPEGGLAPESKATPRLSRYGSSLPPDYLGRILAAAYPTVTAYPTVNLVGFWRTDFGVKLPPIIAYPPITAYPTVTLAGIWRTDFGGSLPPVYSLPHGYSLPYGYSLPHDYLGGFWRLGRVPPRDHL